MLSLTSKSNSLDLTPLDNHYYEHTVLPSVFVQTQGQVQEKLCEDVFYSLFKSYPMINEADNMFPSHLLNLELIKQLHESPEYKNLHIKTRHDEEMSAYTTEELAKRIIDGIGKETKEFVEDVSEYEQSLLNGQGKSELLEEIINALKNYEAPSQEQLDQLSELEKELQKTKDNNDQMTKLISEAQEMLEATLRANQAALFAQVNQSAKETNNGITELMGMCNDFGLEVRDKDGSKISSAERLELAKKIKNNKKVLEIAKMLGRMRRMARNIYREVGEPEEIVSVVTGNDIPSVLPSELGLLNIGLRSLFFKKYAESSLLQYDRKDNVIKGEGAIIVCLDQSGSMSGHREFYSKALSLGIMEICKDEDRDLIIIPFSGSLGRIFTFPKGKYNSEAMVDFASYMLGGGTAFIAPLREVMKIVSENLDYKDSDCLFITDGWGHITPEFQQEYLAFSEDSKIRTLGMMISGDPKVLEGFCTKVVDAKSLEDDTAEEIYSWLAKK